MQNNDVQANDIQDRADLRRTIYMLLIVLGLGMVIGRILAVDAVDRTAVKDYRVKKRLAAKREALQAEGLAEAHIKKSLKKEEARLKRVMRLRRPFLSANDRSRWCTVRALVENDLRVPGHPYAIDKVIREPGWDTIDMVKHDGHLYSSKPPLLPSLLAGEYWIIHRVTGLTLGTHPHEIGRFMLITVNAGMLLIYFVLLARLIERFGTTDWGRIFVMAAAVFGTFLTTFAVVINNHVPAAVCALAAVYATVRIVFDRDYRWHYFAIAGLFAALTVTNELPALALLGLLSALLLWKAPWETVLVYVPAVVVVAAAFFGTNWLAHEDLRPPYLHRSEGDNWYDYEYERNGRVYESYWRNPVGVDRGEPHQGKYAAHLLVGHHGIFSLTPVWILSFAGMIWWVGQGKDANLRQLGLLILIATAACLAFYLMRPEHHRNYGGVTSGLRWMFWFAPLWLLTALPVADLMSRRRWSRALALVGLLVSVLSASYPTWNPWTHPWIMDCMHYLWWG